MLKETNSCHWYQIIWTTCLLHVQYARLMLKLPLLWLEISLHCVKIVYIAQIQFQLSYMYSTCVTVAELMCSWDCFSHVLQHSEKTLTNYFFFMIIESRSQMCVDLCPFRHVNSFPQLHPVFIFSLFGIWCHAWIKYLMILGLAVFISGVSV